MDTLPNAPTGQASGWSMPATQKCPGGHTSLQFEDRAMEDEYSPGAHWVHSAAPPRLKEPGGHSAAVALSEPGRHWNPALPTKAHSAGGGGWGYTTY
jgi:hypothetical protein